MSKLTGKIVVVTGGSAGIGQGISARFVAEDAQVFITGRNRARLDKAVAEIGGNVSAVQGDASNLTDIDRIYQTVREKAGRIDVLVVNAGFYESGTLGEITEEHPGFLHWPRGGEGDEVRGYTELSLLSFFPSNASCDSPAVDSPATNGGKNAAPTTKRSISRVTIALRSST